MKTRLLFLSALLIVAFSSAEEPEYFTHTYVVPPTFPKAVQKMAQDNQAPPILESLRGLGIHFPVGTSAIYVPATSQIIVKNTKEQMARIEKVIQDSIQKVELQLYLTASELRLKDVHLKGIAAPLFEELEPVMVAPMSARRVKSRSDLLRELQTPPLIDEDSRVAKNGISGPIPDVQARQIITQLREQPGVEWNQFPSLMMRREQFAILKGEDTRIGIEADFSKVEDPIRYQLYFPETGKALPPNPEHSRFAFAIESPDEFHVVYAEQGKDGDHRLLFVKGVLLDPAGMPIPKPKVEKKPENAGNQPDDEAPMTPQEQALLISAEKLATEAIAERDKGNESSALEKFREAAQMLPERKVFDPWRKAYLAESVMSGVAPLDIMEKFYQEGPENFTAEQQEAVKRADELALRGSQLMANGDHGEAIQKYREALLELTPSPMTVPRLRAYHKQFSRAKDSFSKD